MHFSIHDRCSTLVGLCFSGPLFVRAAYCRSSCTGSRCRCVCHVLSRRRRQLIYYSRMQAWVHQVWHPMRTKKPFCTSHHGAHLPLRPIQRRRVCQSLLAVWTRQARRKLTLFVAHQCGRYVARLVLGLVWREAEVCGSISAGEIYQNRVRAIESMVARHVGHEYNAPRTE